MRAVVAGGTGLTGSFLLRALSASAAFSEVIALTRHDKSAEVPKIIWCKTDYADPDALQKACKGADAAFCALGTTIAKAGSKEAFIRVDRTFVLNFAEAAKAAGCMNFYLISAVGASSDSRVFYSRVKGETEAFLRDMGFASLGIFRPSFLEGPREERRLGEKIGGGVMKLLSPLMAGHYAKYKPVHVKVLAEAMIGAALEKIPGDSVYTYPEIVHLAEGV